MPAPPPRVIHAPDGSEVTILADTLEQQNELVAEHEAEWQSSRLVVQFVQDFEQSIDALSASHWDFLDSYGTRYWPGQQGTPGVDWPQFSTDPIPPFPADADPTTLAQAIVWVNRKVDVLVQRDRLLQLRTNVLDDRAQILRQQVEFVTYVQTREARLFRLILAVLRRQIERDPTLVPPPES